MTQTLYCEQADVYRFVAPGLLQVPARVVAAVSTTAYTFTLQGHGLSTDDELAFRADGGGSLPTGLTAGVTYYAIVVSPDVFSVAAAPGGTAVHFTTAGTNVVACVRIPWTRFITECSAVVEQVLIAHAPPLLDSDGNVPQLVREFTAARLAMRALAYCGRETEAVQASLDRIEKEAERWSRGVPLRGASRPASTNVAITRSAAQVDPRGWDRAGGRFP